MLSLVRQHTAGRRVVALAAGLGVAWFAFYAAWLAIRPGGDRALTIFSDTAYLVPLLAATVFCAYAWLRAPRELRAFWGLMTAACGAWLFADTLWCAARPARGLGALPVVERLRLPDLRRAHARSPSTPRSGRGSGRFRFPGSSTG